MDQMNQLNQCANNIVKIVSDWKVENDKYTAHIKQLNANLASQIVSLQSLVDSNSTTQSNTLNAAKIVEKESGKRKLAQSPNENVVLVQSKRIKTTNTYVAATCKLLVHFNFCSITVPLIFHSIIFFFWSKFHWLIHFILASDNVRSNISNRLTVPIKHRPFVLISPLEIKNENCVYFSVFLNEFFSIWLSLKVKLTLTFFHRILHTAANLIKVNSRTNGKLTVSMATGKVHKNASLVNTVMRSTRNNSKVQNQTVSQGPGSSQAAKKGRCLHLIQIDFSLGLFTKILTTSHLTYLWFTENESWFQGGPLLTSTPLLGEASKKTASKVTPNVKKVAENVTGGRIMTRRATKL